MVDTRWLFSLSSLADTLDVMKDLLYPVDFVIPFTEGKLVVTAPFGLCFALWLVFLVSVVLSFAGLIKFLIGVVF